MINPTDYQHLIEFMTKSLFQGAASTFEEAVIQWKITGSESVNQVVADINKLLEASYTETDLDEFVLRYSDYAEEDGGRATLTQIKSILTSMSPGTEN